MNIADQYNREIEKIFRKMERRWQLPRKAISKEAEARYNKKFTVMSIVASGAAVAGAAGLVLTSVISNPGVGTAVTTLLAGGGGAVIGRFAARNLIDSYVITPVRIFGKAEPIRIYQAETINAWAKRHPRLVEMLGKWGAKNLDGQLNSVDFDVLDKNMRKIEALEELRDNAIENETALSKSGITQSIKRTKLGKIAKNGSQDSGGVIPVPNPKI